MRANGVELGHGPPTLFWCCPYCQARLEEQAHGLFCAPEGRWFATDRGVHRLLTEERRREIQAALELQQRARRDEQNPEDPQVRVRLQQGLALAAARLGTGPWSVLEVGARSCSSSLELLREGHSVAAVGIDLDAERGLLAVDSRLPPDALLPRAEGEMESIPLEPGLFDLVVAHDSLHYAPRPVRALVEIRRVTRRGGLLLVLESPVFRRRGEGEARVADHMREQSRRYNFPVPREAEPGYLVLGELQEMFRSAGWILEIHGWPSLGAEWAADIWDFLRSGGRRPRTPVLVARRDG